LYWEETVLSVRNGKIKMKKKSALDHNIGLAETRDLVAYYNRFSGKPPVKKFRDRATAERRVKELAEKIKEGRTPS
jgi:hypothetical protein